MRVKLVVDGKVAVQVVERRCTKCTWAVVLRAGVPACETRAAMVKRAKAMLKAHKKKHDKGWDPANRLGALFP